MKTLIALFFVAALPAAAQKVEVPHKLDFAGITLVIRDDARREIQKDVDALTASPRHYQIKAERARTYFPIIEKIFREEGLPDDFKYLVLQESALIPDAVSTSNAVGFWQFKDFTAMEMGLRIDRQIDERMNIVASSRAAARYIIKNNQYFDNWVYALQSYQMGAGGVMKSVKDTEAGASRMEITGKTYWYVKKFLAHMIAYEDGVKGTPAKQIVAFENQGRNTLHRLAREVDVDLDALRELNKWTKSGEIPDDKTYVVLLPVEGPVRDGGDVVLADNLSQSRVTPTPSVARARGKINGVSTIRAVSGDNVRILTAHAVVDLPKFLKWNDMEKGDEIVPGQVYFLGRKRLKGSADFHKVELGETLWMISQQYGLKLKRLRRYNRLEDEVEPAPGTMLYLASRRPREDAVVANVENPVEVSKAETFNWAVTTESEQQEVVRVTPVVINPTTESEIDAARVVSKPVDSLKILQVNKTGETLPDTVQAITLPIPENNRHIVQAGETLYGIARLYDITVMDIVSLNDLSLQEGIQTGQVLRLPGEDAEASQQVSVSEETVIDDVFYHEVKTSDTLYSISRRYNVTIQQIMEWNQKTDFSLTVGEKIRIMRAR